MKPGTVVKIKNSGEPVTVLNHIASESVEVSRAKVTQNGIEYIREVFSEDELESLEQAIDREYEEMLYRHSLAKKGQAALDASEGDVTPSAIQ